MLFRKTGPANRELPQREREAIVDLLHLCLYGDSHIALTEGEFLSDVVNIIGWETQSSFSSYEAPSIAHARAAHANAESRKDFVALAAGRLQSKESRALAVDLCAQLFAVDGTTAAKESALLALIRAELK
jgi:hypothetical protein